MWKQGWNLNPWERDKAAAASAQDLGHLLAGRMPTHLHEWKNRGLLQRGHLSGAKKKNHSKKKVKLLSFTSTFGDNVEFILFLFLFLSWVAALNPAPGSSRTCFGFPCAFFPPFVPSWTLWKEGFIWKRPHLLWSRKGSFRNRGESHWGVYMSRE